MTGFRIEGKVSRIRMGEWDAVRIERLGGTAGRETRAGIARSVDGTRNWPAREK